MRANTPRAFTMIELLASIAIIAVLTATAGFFVASYINWSKKTANETTLATLNGALQEYKTLGGMRKAHSLEGTNSASKFQAIIDTLKAGVTVYNSKKPFLNQGDAHIDVDKLYATGEGKNFYFSGYGDVDSGTDTPASSFAGNYVMPAPPDGVGKVWHASGALTIPNITTSTGFFAYQWDGGTIQAMAHGSNKALTGSGTKLTFWSCASLASSAQSGNVTGLNFNSTNITAIDWRSLNALTNADLRYCASLAGDIDLSGKASLTSFLIGGYGQNMSPGVTSINMSGCSNWNNGYIHFGNGNTLTAIHSIDLTNCSKINNPIYETTQYTGSSWTLLSVVGCSSLTTLEVKKSKLTTLDLTDCTSIRNLYTDSSSIASINLTPLTDLQVFSAPSTPLQSVNFSNCPNLVSVNLSKCPNLAGDIDLSGKTSLTSFLIGGYGQNMSPGVTSINMSGCSNWNSGYIHFGNGNTLTAIHSIDLTNCSKINNPIYETTQYTGSSWTLLSVVGCSSLTTLEVKKAKFSSTTLNQIYTDLPSQAGTINVTGNTGASGDDPTIATSKGWTVTGS